MNKIKAVLITFFTAIISWMGILAIPSIALVIFNITDYLTGLIASKHRGQKVDSYKGILGISKKIVMWILIGVGATLDWVVLSSASYMGITLPFNFTIAILVAVWLVINETISILENIIDIGVDPPPFLMPIVKYLKTQVENKVEIKEEKEDK